MKLIYKISVLLSFMFAIYACGDDYLNPDVTEYTTGTQIEELGETSPEALASVLEGMVNGVYAYMAEYQGNHDVFSYMAVGLAGDLMTEDMAQLMNHWFYYDYQIDNRGATYRRVVQSWTTAYTLVSKSNEVIGKIAPDVSDPTLKSYLGQALALRSLGYHIAIQRFQQTYKGNESAPGVPLYLTSMEGSDAVEFPRGTVQDVYDQIVKDLNKSVELLDGYSRGVVKTTIDQKVAAGLLARVYMVMEDWANAAKFANMARQGQALMSASECATDGFNDINNKEWMWGGDITGETTTQFASFFSHICTFDAGYGGEVGVYKAIDRRLFDQIGANDARRSHFKVPGSKVDPTSELFEEKAAIYTNLKFKKVASWLADYVYMRAAEMYLIEAEALAHQGNGAEAARVLGLLMANRDPNWNKSSVSVEDVFLQKRIELWGEGLIFYDYLRLKKGVNRNYDGTNHLEKINLSAGDWRFIYQLPQTELDNNFAITDADQNP